MLDMLPPTLRTVWVVKVESSMGLHNKFVGPHKAPDGTIISADSELVLNLRCKGLSLLFIVRTGTIIFVPKANDEIQLEDIMYIKQEQSSRDSGEGALKELREMIKKRELASMLLQYDSFIFPEHSWGKTLKDLNLPANFGIQLAFLAFKNDQGKYDFHSTGPDSKIKEGCYGVVACLPDPDTGNSVSALSDELLAPMYDESRFETILKQQSLPAATQTWRRPGRPAGFSTSTDCDHSAQVPLRLSTWPVSAH